MVTVNGMWYQEEASGSKCIGLLGMSALHLDVCLLQTDHSHKLILPGITGAARGSPCNADVVPCDFIVLQLCYADP